jgi:hypothetical protein
MLFNQKIEIKKENPFENCKLNRKQYAEILTKIIDSYNNGFVLAINNKWGTGKTTFIKMWEKKLNQDEFKTIYFNAWENDFEDSPLTALMGELKTLENSSNKEKFHSLLKKSAILTKNIAPALIEAISKKYIDTEIIKDAIKATTKGASEIFEYNVNEYINKKKSMVTFRNELSEFVSNTSKGKPLVFFIDELDRCRPNYSVSILEQVKHFFNVPNIIFVLSIDKQHLRSSIEGVYGSQNIDTNEYLRRFIDIEYSIPEPNFENFINHKYQEYNFDDFFNWPERIHREFNNDKKVFKNTCLLLLSDLTLRQIEKILIHTRIAIRLLKHNEYLVPQVFLFLNVIKISKPDLYYSLQSKSINVEQFQTEFEKIIKPNSENHRDIIWLEAFLVNFYHNYIEENNYNRKRITFLDDKHQSKCIYNTKIKFEESESDFLIAIESLHRGMGHSGSITLGFFFKNIELLNNLKS